MGLLESIHSPADLRKLPKEQLPQVASEVRQVIIDTVSETGGHFGAGLGATDLTVALHYVLDTPQDFLVWDVGHQVQAHKILTGRREAFRKTFRQYKGCSGLVNKDESEFDPFTTGHAAASISAALGVSVGRRLQGKSGRVVAVIGDASIASGMAFEAMNHAGHLDENLVVILNDNEMSISPSVGALSKYLNKVISSPIYNSIRNRAGRVIGRMPHGKDLVHKAKQIEEGVKHLLVPGLIFEALGFRYFGPIDGHQLVDMVNLFPNILKIKGPLMIHVITQKGKGYALAEADPERWHASTPFNVETGELKKVSTDKTYTHVFGETMIELAEKNPKITALTGGMPEGTGLLAYAKKFPDRFFDIGISEEHGVTFCAGLAHDGMRPVAAIYSTFLQRAHDQIIHDVALQNLPVMFCLDRGGLVGEDGPTHHGAFDYAYLRKIPNMTVLAPRDGKELAQMMRFMVSHVSGPISVRYPRGPVGEILFPEFDSLDRHPVELGKAQVLKEGRQVAILAIGSMVGTALRTAALLEKEGISVTVVNMRFVKPLDVALVRRVASTTSLILTLEEGSIQGGFGSAVLEALAGEPVSLKRVIPLGLPDEFIEGGNRNTLLDRLGLTPEKIARLAQETLPKISEAVSADGDALLSRKRIYS